VFFSGAHHCYEPLCFLMMSKWVKHKIRWQIWRITLYEDRFVKIINPNQLELFDVFEEKIYKLSPHDQYTTRVRSMLVNIFGEEWFREKPIWFYIRCPYHGEKNPSMMISKNIEYQGLCKCYACGKVVNFDNMWKQTWLRAMWWNYWFEVNNPLFNQ